MQAGLISDSLDFVTGPASSRLVGRRARPIGTMTVLPSLALDVIGLGRLAGTPDRPTDRPTDRRPADPARNPPLGSDQQVGSDAIVGHHHLRRLVDGVGKAVRPSEVRAVHHDLAQHDDDGGRRMIGRRGPSAEPSDHDGGRDFREAAGGPFGMAEGPDVGGPYG